MTALHVGPLAAATGCEDPVLIICPQCAEGQMRYAETAITRSTIDIALVCCSCEQRASLHIDFDRMQTRAPWQWAQP